MTFEQREIPDGPWTWKPDAPRLVALRTALRALPVRGSLHPTNPGPAGIEEMDRLRLLTLRGVLVAWASALYPGVKPGALARAAAALDAVTVSVDAGRARLNAERGYGSDHPTSAIEDDHDCARQAIRWVREALADPPGIPSGGWFDTLKFSGPDGWENHRRWQRLQAEALEADRAVLARYNGGAEAVRALAAAPLWPDARSADAAAVLTHDVRNALACAPGPVGGNAVRWLEERRHGALVHPRSPAAERLVRIASLPDFFWDAGSADDAGHALDRILGSEPTSPTAGGAPFPFRDEEDGTGRPTKPGPPREGGRTTLEPRELPGGRWYWELLAQRTGLYSLPAYGSLYAMDRGPVREEEIGRLRLLTLRGALVSWASALHPAVEPGALARAAAALDAMSASVYAALGGFDGPAYENSSLKAEEDRAREVVQRVRGALADPSGILADGGFRLREAALEVDRVILAEDDARGEAVQALAAAPLRFDSGSAAATGDPGGAGWDLTHSRALQLLVRIANLPDSFWDAGPADDVGRTLDDFLGSVPTGE